jgi:hypothetical protein
LHTTRQETLTQRWHVVQHELLPELRHEIGLTPKLKRLVHTLEWARVEEFCSSRRAGTRRPPHERAWLANAFLAKPVPGLEKTSALHERLTMDRSPRRVCGFPMVKKLPSESTFFRAFGEFARTGLAGRAHAALIRWALGGKFDRPFEP